MQPEIPAPIGVLVVDDSAFMRTALSRMINSDPALFVLGTACSGEEALDKIPELNPDVITLDMLMPGMDGLETLRCIRARFPCPVIIVSSSTVDDAKITFEALAAGAFDYVPKQLSPASLDIIHIRSELIAKLKAAAESRRRSSVRKPPVPTPRNCDTPAINPAIVAVGSSTGGPQALESILTQLPSDLAIPVLIVQHMPPGFTKPFAERLDSLCAVNVREASQRELVRAGVAYIAPAGIHLTVERSSSMVASIVLMPEPSDALHIPSVNVMMESVAAAFGTLTMGIILTGMGCDGAEGMTAIHRAGGITIGQDEGSSAVYGMPRACAERGILQAVVPLSQIARHILNATHYRKRA